MPGVVKNPWVASRGTSVAIVQESRTVTYHELHGLVGGYRHRLAGVPAGERVVIRCERSPETIAAYLACLSLGITFVPVDADRPAAYAEEIVRRSEAWLCLEGEDLRPGAVTASNWTPAEVAGQTTAYIMFTSGSTGQPKGVMISHDNLAAYVTEAKRTYDLRPDDRVLQVASLGFDWSISEILPTLAIGAVLVLRSEDALSSAAALADHIRAHDVSVLSLPTAVWHALSPDFVDGSVELPATMRHLTIGGEQAALVAVQAWVKRFAAQVRTINTYGPTECTVEAVFAELGGHGIDVMNRAVVPLGSAIPGCRIYVLDSERRPAEQGIIFIAGHGVGQGYFRDLETTAAKFVTDPYDGSLMYDTGDLGRWNEFGELEFLGRVDNQVKIAGFRVELEEVEQWLMRCPGVEEAAVTWNQGAESMTAFVAPSPDVDAMRLWMGERLPAHLIPPRIVSLQRLPRTINDKIDRKSLLSQIVSSGPVVEGDEVEQGVRAIWTKVLGVGDVQAGSDFFQLGGHSLVAVKTVGELQKRFGIRVQLRDLYQTRTLAALAEAVRVKLADRG